MKIIPTPSPAALAAAVGLALGLSGCIITIDDGGARWHSYSAMASSGNGPVHHGSGTAGVDERSLAPVHAVLLEGIMDVAVTVTPGATQAVRVVGDDNLLASVRTRVEDGVLEVDLDDGSYYMKQPLRVEVTVPRLTAVELEGAGDVSVQGLDADDFRVSLQGSGDVYVTGRTRQLTAGLFGSGDVDLGDLVAVEASARLEGSGDIRVHAEEQLDLRLHGSGDIGYRGNPRVSLQLSGSGDVYTFQ